MESELETLFNGVKSLGKVFWISTGIFAGTLFASDYIKNEKTKMVTELAGDVSGLIALGSMYNNRNKIGNAVNPYFPNWYVEKLND